MNLTDEQIIRAYAKATNNRPMTTDGSGQARTFIGALFDEMTPAGYLDPDGAFHAEEWEASADCEPVYRRYE